MSETLRERAIALHSKQATEAAYRKSEEVERERQVSLNSLHDAVMRCLSLSEEAMKSATISTVDTDDQEFHYRLHIEGLTFRHFSVRTYGYEVIMLLAPCARCGRDRFTHGISNLGTLGSILAQDGDDWTPHRCPDEPEYWLINREVREAEIAALAERREANDAKKADRLQTVLSTLVSKGVSQDSIANLLSGFMAVATGFATGGQE